MKLEKHISVSIAVSIHARGNRWIKRMRLLGVITACVKNVAKLLRTVLLVVQLLHKIGA
jgi:hypothetical protein